MPLPLTGEQYEISAGDYRAVVTQLGAGLRELRHGDRALVAGYGVGELPPAGAGELLAPWPNRVDGGRYSFGGGSFQLDLSDPKAGNAIHGLTRWATWTAQQHEAGRVRLSQLLLGRPGYPFCLRLEAEYWVEAEAGLRVEVSARNEGDAAAPYGTGSHPYLTAGTPVIDECTLTLPAARWLPLDERGIPSGPERGVDGADTDFRRPRPIGGVRLDHALTGLDRDADGRAWVRLAGPEHGVALWAGPGYDWLQVFTADPLDERHRRRAIAVEPMTCPPNAFVSGASLITLAPGESTRHAWGIRLADG